MAKAARKPKTEELDDAGYPTHPRDLTKTAWFYEQSDGLQIVQECKSAKGVHLGTVQTTVPWSAVEAAVDRHRKTKSR